MPQKRTLFLNTSLAILVGLLSNVVANYLPPLFEGRRWLAVGLFMLLALLDVVRNRIGHDQQARRQTLRRKIQKSPSPQLASVWLKPGFVVLIGVLAVALWFAAPWAGDAVAQAAPSCPPARLCIAVAPFQPQGTQAARDATDQIDQAIRQVFAASESDRFVVRRLEQPVDTVEQARSQAQAEADLLIVWGQLFTTQSDPPPLTVNFEFADPMGVEAQSTSPYRALPLQPMGDKLYCTQCLVGVATQQAQIVAYMAAGLAHYARSQPRRARLDFSAALYCAGELAQKATGGLLPPACTPADKGTGNPSLLYYYLGKAYFLEGDYPHAIGYLAEAAQRNPQDLATLVGLAAAHKAWRTPPGANAADPSISGLGSEESTLLILQAQKLAEELRGQAPPDIAPVIDYNLGLFYEVVEEIVAAQAAYQQAAVGFGEQQKSGQYMALLGLARSQAELENVDAARATLEQARALAPILPWADLALARLAATEPPTAQKWLAQAELLVAPDEAIVDIARAELCTQWQDYTCAAQAYARALKKQPENGRLHSQVGNFYLPSLHPESNLKSWELAATHYRQVADVLRPQDPWSHQRLAYVLQNMQDNAGAIEHYQAIIERLHPQMQTSPSDLVASLYCNLGVSLERSGKKTEAYQSYEQCEQLAVTDARRMHANALLQAMNGQQTK